MSDKEKIKLIIGIINNIEPYDNSDEHVTVNKEYTNRLLNKFELFSGNSNLDMACYVIVDKYKSLFGIYNITPSARKNISYIQYLSKAVNWRESNGNTF